MYITDNTHRYIFLFLVALRDVLRTDEAGPSKRPLKLRRHKENGLHMIVADKTKTYQLIDALHSIDTESNLSEERMAAVVRLSLQDWMLLENFFLADGFQLPLRKWDSAADLTREILRQEHSLVNENGKTQTRTVLVTRRNEEVIF